MRTLDALADLLLGAACPGCGTPRWGVCPNCRALVAGPRLHVPLMGLQVWGLADYEGPAGAMVRALKDGGAWSVAKVCGPGLRAGLARLTPTPVTLVPAPSTAAAVRRRGFDHSRALARAAARPGDQVAAALSRARRVHDQAALDHDRRQTNQHDSMQAIAPGSGAATCVVIDDICTTGATLLEARRALSLAGWQVAGAVVVAVTPRHLPEH